MPTARNVGRSSCGLPYPASSQRSRPSVALHVCVLTGAPRRRRPSRCPPFHAPIPPVTSTNCPAASDGGGGDSLAHHPGADGRCTSLVTIPPYPPPGRFGCATAGYVDRPQAAMGSGHRPGTALGLAGDRPPSRAPAGDPTPITHVKVPIRAKLRVLIETRELRLSSRECDLTSLPPALSIVWVDGMAWHMTHV